MKRTRCLILACCTAGLLAAPYAAAQGQDTPPQGQVQNEPQTGSQTQAQPQPRPKGASDFSQEQIEKFADAAIGVQQLKAELDVESRKVETRDDLARLQERATVEASKVVEDSGLSIQEYSEIVEAANQDPRLYATIVDLMQQRSSE